MFIVTEYAALTLKAPITIAADGNFCDIFPNFQKNKVWYADDSHEIWYHICYFWKSSTIWNCRLLQIIGCALWINVLVSTEGLDKTWKMQVLRFSCLSMQ